MLILSNALTDTPDEGCVKVACSLVRRLRNTSPSAHVISYDRPCTLSDEHLPLNKLLLHPSLARQVWNHRKNFLFIPFPTRALPAAARALILALYTGRRVNILLSMTPPLPPLARFLYRLSGAQFYVLSQSAYQQYSQALGADHVTRLKTGVDVQRFLPVDDAAKRALKAAYGLDPDRKVVLHVGHLKAGRNIAQLMKISAEYQVVLVTSTLTKDEQDVSLAAQLRAQANIRLITEYIPHIEQLYQLADAYFFPVVQEANCIDVPLSCLEAAACNVPVVTTDYGEMRELIGQDGFIHLRDMGTDTINAALNEAFALKTVPTRDAVLPYDWNQALHQLQHLNKKDCVHT